MINLEKTLRVGNEVRFKSKDTSFITVICNIIDKNIIKILLPTNNKESIIIFRGEKYNITCVNEKAMFMLETMVKDVYAIEEVIAVELEALSYKKVQRRDAFRVNESIFVKVRKVFSEDRPEEVWKASKTIDISETGMQIKVNEPYVLGQQLELILDIDNFGLRETFTDIKGKVVRCSRRSRGYYLGIKFDSLPPKAKNTILKLVVLSQRNRLAYNRYFKREGV